MKKKTKSMRMAIGVSDAETAVRGHPINMLSDTVWDAETHGVAVTDGCVSCFEGAMSSYSESVRENSYDFSTAEGVEAYFQAITTPLNRPEASAPNVTEKIAPLRITSGFAPNRKSGLTRLRSKLSTSVSTPEAAPDETRKRRAKRQKRVVDALRAKVENDPEYNFARKEAEKAQTRYSRIITSAGQESASIVKAADDLSDAISFADDFYLVNLAALAERIERCGLESAFACGSDYCPHCRSRFGARLMEDTKVQLTQRYGGELENSREKLVHVTILNEIVIPDPDLDSNHLADFSASTIRRDHRELLAYLQRWQSDRRSAMSHLLTKRKLGLHLIEDWMAATNRDRRFYSADNLYADAIHLVRFNQLIESAREKFKSRRSRLKNPPNTFVSWRDKENTDGYMWQLRKAHALNGSDIYVIAHGLQCIYHEFKGFTKTKFPERLKFKSSIEKVMKRERTKLYRLNKDLPGISLIGQFELELIDLRHSIGGNHQHSTKSRTLRLLASQPRKSAKRKASAEHPSPEAERRRIKQSAKARLLDDARERIAKNLELPEADFPGLQYAVLLHIHALIDLNGHSRENLERWLSGRKVGDRKFNGFWTLPHQVMVKRLFEDKPIDDSLRSISFYPFKGPTTFNYENAARKHDEEIPENDPAHFTDEALALLAWLQVGVGHESLRLSVNWPGVDRERRGRKPTKQEVPKVTEEEFMEEIEPMLAELGLSLPTDPSPPTDLSELFEAQPSQESSGGDDTRSEEREGEGGINGTAPLFSED